MRFISAEPLLGPIDIGQWLHDSDCQWAGASFCTCNAPRELCLDWVIAGGESGGDARPTNPAWLRRLRDQCGAAAVPFLFKQWGEWTPGENVEAKRGSVPTASWFDNSWSVGRESLSRDGGHRDEQPDLYRIGKKLAGRRLDGDEHTNFPGGAS